MTRVTNTDQVLLLLRERLSRGERRERSAPGDRIRGPAGDTGPLDRLRVLAALDALDDDQRRRAIVQGLLLDELGDGVANDPGFQAVVDEVVRIISDMPGGADMIDSASAALRP